MREDKSHALSIIIPTLDEARSIGATLDALARDVRGVEVIVVDGGSRDGTVELVRGRGVKLIESGRARALVPTRRHAAVERVRSGD
jgi:glycosyltransferase involved in cell wall biosynthesis